MLDESWIGDLASKASQIRYIVNGTADEYLVPDEMLDMAASECEQLLRRDGLTQSQAEALKGLADSIRAAGNFLAGYDRTNIADLVERDPTWSMLRERAGSVVQQFGGDPAHLINPN